MKTKKPVSGKKSKIKEKIPAARKKLDIKGFFRRLVKDKRFRHGGAAVLMTALFAVIIVLSNIVAMIAVEKAPWLSPDLTAGKIYTLSDVTLNLLDQLDEDVQIWIFASEEACRTPSAELDPEGHIPLAYELIKRYEQTSKHIKIIHIDLTTQPGYLNAFDEYRDVLGTYSIAVVSARRTRVTSFYEFLPSLSYSAVTDGSSVDTASSMTETYISSLIKTVTIDKVPVVTYLDGIGGAGDSAYLLSGLALNGYDVSAIDFRTEDIPEGTDIAILSAPEYDITFDQWEKLERFLINGEQLGKTLFVFTNPYMPPTPNLDSLLSDWGIVKTEQIVYEGDSSQVLAGSSPANFRVHYAEGSYTNSLIDRGLITAVSAPLEILIPTQVKGNIVINPVLASSQTGYSADLYTEFREENFTAADAAQRVIMANATYYSDTLDGRQLRSDIIIAPLSLCSEGFYSNTAYANSNLLMTVCNQRCGITDENLDIESKSLTPVDFSVDVDIVKTTTAIFGYIIPLLVLGTGFVVYFRRRRL